jgi:DNA-binding MarR family transcriptional regulator
MPALQSRPRTPPVAKRQRRSDAPIAEGRLASLLGYALRRAQVRVFQDFAATMADIGLTPGQLGALFLIEANRGLSQSRLGQALGIDRSSVVPLIDRLQAMGVVRRSARASDRRAHALELSEQGAALVRRLMPALEAHEQRIASGLSAAERRALIAVLNRVAASGGRPD